MPTLTTHCPACQQPLWAAYTNRRTVVTREGNLGLVVQVRRCRHPGCPRFGRPLRPEAEGRIVLPKHEFGLDLIALVGALRYTPHRSIPEIHPALIDRGGDICPRSVTNLLDRSDELRALSLSDPQRLRRITGREGRVILAIDGLPPDVGHEVLGVLRDGLSGAVLRARSLLSSCRDDLARLLTAVPEALGVPRVGVVSEGQDPIRTAVPKALSGVPHQLGHFPYLREAATPIFEADRHAPKELKKRVRGVRPIDRRREGRHDPEAQAIRGYGVAVRSRWTDAGRPPRAAPGLKWKGRWEAVVARRARVAEKRGSRPN